MGIESIMSGIYRAGTASLKDDAVGIPLASYDSAELYHLEVERLFRPGWIMIGRVDEVPAPDSYATVDILGEALIMTRDSAGEFHVFSRLCPHRGMEVANGSGCAKRLQCPYHSWTFDLAGTCRSAPFMDDTAGFDRARNSLRPIRFEVWMGFVFVNLDGQAPSITTQLQPLTAQVADAGLESMIFVDKTDYGEQPIDWKMLLENSAECYHHCGTHAKSIQAKFPAELSRAYAEFPEYHITYSVAKDSDGPIAAAHDRLNHSTASIVTIYPVTHFSFRANLCNVLMISPLGPGRCHVQRRLMLPKDFAETSEAEELIKVNAARMGTIFNEDFAMCGRLQRMTSSSLFKAGRLSQLEKPVWHFYRYLAGHLAA